MQHGKWLVDGRETELQVRLPTSHALVQDLERGTATTPFGVFAQRRLGAICDAKKGAFLRRLYSTFAGGWPGIGLLLMRLVGGLALIARASLMLGSGPPVNTTISSAFLLGSGVLLIPGLWTPIAGTLVALSACGQIVTRAGDPLTALLLGTIGAALAMLGPGLWSVDARLFGWKRVEAPPRKKSL